MTPPPRVENNQPHVVADDKNITRAPLRVVPQHNGPHHNGPHAIPQCNSAFAHALTTIPPYY
eukprot:3919502-Ditylum_brightwellii.AAC.1